MKDDFLGNVDLTELPHDDWRKALLLGGVPRLLHMHADRKVLVSIHSTTFVDRVHRDQSVYRLTDLDGTPLEARILPPPVPRKVVTIDLPTHGGPFPEAFAKDAFGALTEQIVRAVREFDDSSVRAAFARTGTGHADFRWRSAPGEAGVRPPAYLFWLQEPSQLSPFEREHSLEW